MVGSLCAWFVVVWWFMCTFPNVFCVTNCKKEECKKKKRKFILVIVKHWELNLKAWLSCTKFKRIHHLPCWEQKTRLFEWYSTVIYNDKTFIKVLVETFGNKNKEEAIGPRGGFKNKHMILVLTDGISRWYKIKIKNHGIILS